MLRCQEDEEETVKDTEKAKENQVCVYRVQDLPGNSGAQFQRWQEDRKTMVGQ